MGGRSLAVAGINRVRWYSQFLAYTCGGFKWYAYKVISMQFVKSERGSASYVLQKNEWTRKCEVGNYAY